jgi:hypothetical protein
LIPEHIYPIPKWIHKLIKGVTTWLRNEDVVALWAAPGANVVSLDDISPVQHWAPVGRPTKQGDNFLLVFVNTDRYRVISEDVHPSTHQWIARSREDNQWWREIEFRIEPRPDNVRVWWGDVYQVIIDERSRMLSDGQATNLFPIVW